MTSIINVCKFIHEKALERSNVHSTHITEQEISIKTNLLALLQELPKSDSFTIKSEDSLEFFDKGDFDPDYRIEVEDDEEQQVVGNRQFTLEYMQKVVGFARPNISFTTLQHAYPPVIHPMQLKRFPEYVANKGNRRQKLDRLENFVPGRFRPARDKKFTCARH